MENERNVPDAERRESEAVTIESAAAGDWEAMEKLYRSSYNGVYHTVKSMVREEEAALELVKSCYLQGFATLDQLGQDKDFSAFIREKAAEQVRNNYEKKAPAGFAQMAESQEDFTPETLDQMPNVVLDKHQTRTLLDEIINGFTEGERLAAGFVYFCGFSVEKTAQMLGWEESAIKGLLCQCDKKAEAKAKTQERQELQKLTGGAFLQWLMFNESRMVQLPSRGVWAEIQKQLPDNGFTARRKKADLARESFGKQKERRSKVRRITDVAIYIIAGIAVAAILIGSIMMKKYPEKEPDPTGQTEVMSTIVATE